GPEDTVYCPMPLFHSGAVLAAVAPALASGAAIALRRRSSASALLGDVRRYGCTYLHYVGKALSYAAATEPHPDDADNPLRVAFGNEAPPEARRRFAERFGCRVVDAYGSSENAIAIRPSPGGPPGALGRLPPDVAILDPATGAPCPPGAVGELVNTAGTGLFEGYYGDPPDGSERVRGGRFHSGDLAYQDAGGWVFFAGREPDRLRVDGENLAAGPIEELLRGHPPIADAAVYPVPDPQAGDRVMAALVPAEGARFDPADFAAFLAGRTDLGAKWAPHYLRIVPELPITASHKVLKRRLSDEGTDCADPVWERRGDRYLLRSRMDFGFDEEQEELRALVRRVLDGEGAGAWAAMARTGLLEAAAQGAVRTAIVLRETAARAAPVPALASLGLGALPVAMLGTAEQRAALAPVFAGEHLLTAGFTGPAPVAAHPDGDGFRLHGVRAPVPDAGAARTLLVPAGIDGGGTGVFLVPGDAAGLTAAGERVGLDGVAVPASALLGRDATGEAARAGRPRLGRAGGRPGADPRARADPAPVRPGPGRTAGGHHEGRRRLRGRTRPGRGAVGRGVAAGARRRPHRDRLGAGVGRAARHRAGPGRPLHRPAPARRAGRGRLLPAAPALLHRAVGLPGPRRTRAAPRRAGRAGRPGPARAHPRLKERPCSSTSPTPSASSATSCAPTSPP